MYSLDAIRSAFESWLVQDEPSASGEVRMYCPLCEDPDTSRTPSASINLAKGEWNCLKTDDHGGKIGALADEVGVRIRGTVVRSGSQSKRALPQALHDQDKPYDWQAQLEHGRTTAIGRMRDLLDDRGILPETRARVHLGATGNQLTFPMRPRGGSPWVQVKFIQYRSDGTKTVSQTPGAVAMLWPTEWLDENPTLPVLLCEGETDTMLAEQESSGRYVAVGVTGGAGTVPRDLDRLRGREVYVAFDCDEAGRKGMGMVVPALRAVGARAHPLDLTRLGLPSSKDHGADLSDYFRKYGGTAEGLAAEIDRLRSAPDRERERFKVVTAADLAAPVPPMRWLVRGVFPMDSYGVLAGEKKTLKTYTDLALALAIASGEPFLGEFVVPEPQPVLMYLGEGGERPTRRRLQRLAQWMGLDLATLPLRMVFDAGDITGEEFLSAFERAVADERPGLVIVDPLYAYHPQGVEAQNIYDRGPMLTEIVRMVPDGASFLLADHFRKTGGKELDLDSIAQAGVAAWADSWILQAHDSPPRVDEGEFSLAVQFGSRQWGGAQYTVDWSLGRFDAEAGEHDGDLRVAVRRTDWGAKASVAAAADVVRSHILTLLDAEPTVYTVTQAQELVAARAGVGSAKVRREWSALVTEGRIVAESTPALEGTREVVRDRWRVVPTEGQRLTVPQTEGAPDGE